MDPEKYKLCAYEEIPLMSQAKLKELGETRHLVLHNNLIVDYTDFQHPGYFKTIQQFRGKEVYEIYTQKDHSFNADLIVCHKTIGRLENSPKEAQGHSFYDNIKDSKLNQDHETILAKFDFSKPLNDSVSKLNLWELNLLTEIPKFFNNPGTIMIGHLQSTWDKLFAKEHIWFCSAVFAFYMLGVMVFLGMNYQLLEIILTSHFILLGFLVWTLIEYVIHKFEFHHNMFETKQFKGSDLHHCFPTLPDTLSVSIRSVTPKLVLFIVVFYFIIDPIQIAMMLMGVVFGLIFYNVIHYNAHYGPEINIEWIKKLRTHHLNHHFKDQHSMYGITCTLWDHFYGTMKPKNKLK